MEGQLLTEAKQMKDELIAWRRALHQIPEVGLELPQTVKFITNQLTQLGVEYEVYEDCSCVTAQLGQGEPCILLRGDMDALPITEEADVEFKSTNGCMHACGHDLHVTALLGAVKLLKNHEAELKGTIKFIFQSGEEIFKGAKAAIKNGLMENPHVDAAFGLHVFGAMPLGVVAYGKYSMSSVYGFRINIKGKGTHGSSPESGIDPLTVGAHILIGLQELIAREISASDEAALTIGHFEGGSVPNIIPDGAILEGTLRTFKPEIKDFLMTRIGEIAEGIAKTYRANVTIEELSNVPSLVCDDELMDIVVKGVAELDSNLQMMGGMHGMGSEDFACYAELVPSMYCFIGAGVEDQSKWVGQHNPKILFNEDCLPLASAIYAKTAMGWLNQ